MYTLRYESPENPGTWYKYASFKTLIIALAALDHVAKDHPNLALRILNANNDVVYKRMPALRLEET